VKLCNGQKCRPIFRYHIGTRKCKLTTLEELYHKGFEIHESSFGTSYIIAFLLRIEEDDSNTVAHFEETTK